VIIRFGINGRGRNPKEFMLMGWGSKAMPNKKSPEVKKK
jgi:hypothetical protein